MKIEISEELIREEIQGQVTRMISEKLCSWALKDNLTKVVNKLWDENVNQVVREELSNTDTLRAKVAATLERKIQGQLTALMKKGGSE
jgi:hypothetical protein